MSALVFSLKHKWKQNVYLLILFPVIAFLLMLFFVTLNLLSCHINWNYRCGYDLQYSLKDLGLWIISISFAGVYYFVLILEVY
jgi:hypothetical protein